MRIEINSGGLGGAVAISGLKIDFTTLINKSSSVISSFNSVKKSIYNMNGGVGNLQAAVNDIEQRICTEENIKQNLQSAREKVNSFIELAKCVDKEVSNNMKASTGEFYAANPWAKPTITFISRLNYVISKVLYAVNYGVIDIFKKITEMLIEFYKNRKKKNVSPNPIVVENEIFDSDKFGYYGGDQGRPANKSNADGNITSLERQYLDIIEKNTGKSLSDKKLDEYLSKLNHNGCGYAAVANIVMEYYCTLSDGEKAFKEKFGYNLRDENGNLNYDLLIVDLYSGYNGANLFSLRHSSLRADIQKELINSIIGKQTVDINLNEKVTVSNCKEYLQNGDTVVLNAWNFNLYDENGKLIQTCGGHSMVITGVTEDGRFIVSTWGRKAYVDLSEKKTSKGNVRYSFFTVKFK